MSDRDTEIDGIVRRVLDEHGYIVVCANKPGAVGSFIDNTKWIAARRVMRQAAWYVFAEITPLEAKEFWLKTVGSAPSTEVFLKKLFFYKVRPVD